MFVIKKKSSVRTSAQYAVIRTWFFNLGAYFLAIRAACVPAPRELWRLAPRRRWLEGVFCASQVLRRQRAKDHRGLR